MKLKQMINKPIIYIYRNMCCGTKYRRIYKYKNCWYGKFGSLVKEHSEFLELWGVRKKLWQLDE